MINYAPAVWKAVAARTLEVLFAADDPPTLTILGSGRQPLAVITIRAERCEVKGDGALKIGLMDEGNATQDGTAIKAVIQDGDGQAHIELPCVEGSVPVVGYCALNKMAVSAGARFTIMDIELPIGSVIS